MYAKLSVQLDVSFFSSQVAQVAQVAHRLIALKTNRLREGKNIYSRLIKILKLQC